MKKLLLVVGALCMVGGRAAAWWEVKDNPDRFISVGVNTSMLHYSGSNNNLLNPNTPSEALQPQSQKLNENAFGFDVRIPMAKYVTFSFSYDKLHLDSESIRDANSFQNHQGLDGDRFGMSVRFYLAN